jgi:hypothetical protein
MGIARRLAPEVTMPKPEKVRAKIVTADARAERDLAAVRAQAERKIVKIREELRAREAKITARGWNRSVERLRPSWEV